MKCAVLYGKDDLRVEDRAIPEIKDNEILIKVAFCGICGSDIHIIKGRIPWASPLILGHEYSGEIVNLGKKVKGLKQGDRVTVAPGIICRKCFFCRRGLEHLCANRHLMDGGFAEFVSVPSELVYPLPSNVSYEVGSLAEPLGCCLHAVESASITPASKVLITGGGPIGLMLLKCVKYAGSSLTILSEPHKLRRSLAKNFEADVVVNPTNEDLSQTVEHITCGVGVDVCIEATGLPQPIKDCINSARRGGTIVLMGVASQFTEVSIRPYEIYQKEITLRGSFMRGFAFSRAIDLLPMLDLNPLLTHYFPLEDIHKALEFCQSRKGVKVLINLKK